MPRLTILSPHRDDAAFSLCIALSRWRSRPIKCSVVNLFTRSGYAPWIESQDPGVVSGVRRAEDRAVLRDIGAEVEVHDEEFLDAPLRTGLRVDQVCSPDRAALVEDTLISALERVLASHRSEFVLAPLTLGDHIDHAAVRQAAMRVFPAPSLGFYEDLPYAMWTPDDLLKNKVKESAGVLGIELHSYQVCDATAARTKAQVIAKYRSQITMAEAEAMGAWSEQFGGGERIWLPANESSWRLLTD